MINKIWQVIEMAFEHDRYVILCDYYGVFDDVSPYCYTRNIQSAALLCSLLNEKYKDRPMKFKYRKRKDCTDYEPCLDDIDFQFSIFEPMDKDKE